MTLANELKLSLYEALLRTRMSEEYLDTQYRKGKIRGLGHWGTGLEAVGVGTAMALGKEDVMFTSHRGFAEYVGRGLSVESIYAEHNGKVTGCCKGKGSIHLCDKELGLWGLTGVLGTDYGLAVGTALAFKQQEQDRVACVLFGEGAWQQNDLHPSMLMAVSWNVPVIFVLCYNQWIEHHHCSEVIPVQDIYKIPEAYGLNTFLVEDGNDVLAVYDTVLKASTLARNGKGPAFVECRSYRVAGHHSGDPGQYMPAEEVASWKKRDPINNCRTMLLTSGLLTEEDDGKLRTRIHTEIEEAFERVMQAPEPDPGDVLTDVYAGLEVKPW